VPHRNQAMVYDGHGRRTRVDDPRGASRLQMFSSDGKRVYGQQAARRAANLAGRVPAQVSMHQIPIGLLALGSGSGPHLVGWGQQRSRSAARTSVPVRRWCAGRYQLAQ